MRKILYTLCAVAAVALTVACSDYETYGELKEKEREAISQFIKDSAINVISETVFEAQGNVTDVSKNQFVYLDKSGVYMQIVRKGCGKPIADGENVNVLCRFFELNIREQVVLFNAYNYVYQVDKINVQREGSTYTASFLSGRMFETYGASVPAGWLLTFNYVNIGRQLTEDDELAKVRLIVPHSQGHSTASSNVYPYYYELTFQRDR